ncbi:uncharacterized protein EI90DRAFT_2221456 [Cantharellus anzutake]|uniref:uncharacterized protein n=1 Tax=Cantharellus anzutake TaxID=1750568 RepID=UPI00190413DD|nr:uncharacterized protein EI90DRAFT_2221456 [Cantharellus anzutake]KAF8324912.1 hypothetical protein EI90DRAFT_2221456 [Cantharellus anzutake]
MKRSRPVPFFFAGALSGLDRYSRDLSNLLTDTEENLCFHPPCISKEEKQTVPARRPIRWVGAGSNCSPFCNRSLTQTHTNYFWVLMGPGGAALGLRTTDLDLRKRSLYPPHDPAWVHQNRPFYIHSGEVGSYIDAGDFTVRDISLSYTYC